MAVASKEILFQNALDELGRDRNFTVDQFFKRISKIPNWNYSALIDSQITPLVGRIEPIAHLPAEINIISAIREFGQNGCFKVQELIDDYIDSEGTYKHHIVNGQEVKILPIINYRYDELSLIDPKSHGLFKGKRKSEDINELAKKYNVDELVNSAVNGSDEAFGIIYQLYVNNIFSYIYHKTARSLDSEDLTEIVFTKAWKAIKGYEVKGKPFSAWLFRIARNTVVDHYRTSKDQNQGNLDDLISVAANYGDPEEIVQRREKVRLIRHAVLTASLTPLQKKGLHNEIYRRKGVF